MLSSSFVEFCDVKTESTGALESFVPERGEIHEESLPNAFHPLQMETASHIAQFPQDCFRDIDKVHGEFCRNPFYRIGHLVHWL